MLANSLDQPKSVTTLRVRYYHLLKNMHVANKALGLTSLLLMSISVGKPPLHLHDTDCLNAFFSYAAVDTSGDEEAQTELS
jgi:hypothetical protein